MKSERTPLDAIGLAALHITTRTGVSPLSTLEALGPRGRRIGRWVTVLTFMRLHGLTAVEVGEVLGISTKSIHRMLSALRRVQQSDPAVASALALISDEVCTTSAA